MSNRLEGIVGESPCIEHTHNNNKCIHIRGLREFLHATCLLTYFIRYTCPAYPGDTARTRITRKTAQQSSQARKSEECESWGVGFSWFAMEIASANYAQVKTRCQGWLLDSWILIKSMYRSWVIVEHGQARFIFGNSVLDSNLGLQS